jgi:hypothetical protein
VNGISPYERMTINNLKSEARQLYSKANYHPILNLLTAVQNQNINVQSNYILFCSRIS